MYILLSPERVLYFYNDPDCFCCPACCGNAHISPWWDNKDTSFSSFSSSFFPFQVNLLDFHRSGLHLIIV